MIAKMQTLMKLGFAIVLASAAQADDKGIIWMDSTDGGAVKAPKDKDVIWADSTDGQGVKQPKERDVIWADSSDGEGAASKRKGE